MSTASDSRIAAALAALTFDQYGLVPAVAQQHDTGEVLMLAWMSREAIAETLATGRAVYFSRSRNRLWCKGERSGQTQALIDFRIDCDGDAVLLLVDQTGVACHTGKRRCFFRSAGSAGLEDVPMPAVDPARLYGSPSDA